MALSRNNYAPDPPAVRPCPLCAEMLAALQLVQQFRATPIVDDDFPAIRDRADAAVAAAIAKVTSAGQEAGR